MTEIFDLLIVILIIFFFVGIKQTKVKAEVQKQPLKRGPREKVKQGKSLRKNCEKVIFW